MFSEDENFRPPEAFGHQLLAGMSIPSFTSFPDIELEQAGPTRDSPKSPKRKRETSPGRKEKSRKHKHDSVSDPHRPSKDRPRALSLVPEPESKLFYSDKKGDHLNITMGGLHARSVPKYYRSRGMLGLQPRQYDRERFEEGERYIYERGLSKTTRRLKVASQPAPDFNAEYISLSSTSRRSPRTLLDFDSESPTSSSSRSASPERLPTIMNAALEKRVKEDPTDLTAWHALLAQTSSSPTPKAVAEIKLSILSRALSHLPSSAPLLAARARVSSNLHGLDETNRLWEAAITQARGEGRADVWKEWLGWVFRTKGIEEGVKSVSRAMKACELEDGEVLVDIFGLACGILLHAGFAERAISAYQALLEALFFRPMSLEGAPWSVVVQNLERWWDEEHSRLGEFRECGWGGQAVEAVPVALQHSSTALADLLKDDDLYATWVTQEARASRDKFLPPPAAEQDESDPYRITLFPDIAPLLPFRELSSNEAVSAAWCLLGLLGLGVESKVGPELGAVKVLEGWWELWSSAKDMICGREPFIRSILVQLRSRISGVQRDEWDKLWVAFEWCVGGKSALKLTKHLLASSPSSLVLWSLHADLEQQQKKPDAARKVYQAVLSGQSQGKKRVGEDAMWFGWAVLEWQQGALDKALEILCQAAVGGEGTGSVRILRARQTFDARFSNEPSSEVLSCRALLAYLTSEALSDTLTALELDDRATEELHLARSQFLKVLAEYRGRAPVPPAALREPLEQSAKHYPANVRIVAIYAWNEKREKVWGRVKRLLETILETPRGSARLETWFAAVFSEETAHGKRDWLDRAVRDDRMRSNVHLWKMYVDLELEQGQPAKARSLLYRAVAECPWSKDLHLLAFSDSLKASFRPRELDSWIDVMLERGVRMRVEWTGGPEDDVDEVADSGGEDENEMVFEERRRLMPY